MYIQDVFEEARRRGNLDGFVGTFADIVNTLTDQDADGYDLPDFWAPDEDGALAYERHLESTWAGADQYRWEEEQDRLRNPFDLQTGLVAA